MRIGTNVTALQAYKNLMRTDRSINVSMTRLSSGVRINSVKDDPAGMAISMQMRNQIKGLDMAQRNTMDGISLIQTAEGALSEVHNMLQRMRELSVQAATDSYEPEDRDKLQVEVNELLNEIDLIANRTEFNNMKLLNGSAGTLSSLQKPGTGRVVRTSNQVDIGQYEFSIESMGEKASVDFGVPTLNLEAVYGRDSSLTINGEEILIDASDTGYDILRKLEQVGNRVGIEVVKENGQLASLQTKAVGKKATVHVSGDAHMLHTLNLSSTQAQGKDMVISDMKLTNATVDEMTRFNSQHDYQVDGNRVIINNGGGEEIVLDVYGNSRTPVGGGEKFIFSLHDGGLNIQVGQNKDMSTLIKIEDMSTYGLEIDTLNIQTIENAEDAIQKLDKAINIVSDIRATLGGYQNRFEYTTESLAASSEQASMALSRVFDADIALEMMELAKLNILSQAGISIMAQANMRPQQILQLME